MTSHRLSIVHSSCAESNDLKVIVSFDRMVCHAHAAWACFLVKTHVHEDVDMAHITIHNRQQPELRRLVALDR